MKQINTLTAAPKQRMQLVLENNETADFYLYFDDRMENWFFDISYNDITLTCVEVCLHPNILRQLRRLIPFGIAFISNNKVNPFLITSFSSGECGMYVLNEEEVKEVEETIYNS